MDYNSLRKRALIFDFVAILVAAAVLFSAQRLEVPQWVTIAGAVISVAALVIALKYSFKARKIANAEYKQFEAEQGEELVKAAQEDAEAESEEEDKA